MHRMCRLEAGEKQKKHPPKGNILRHKHTDLNLRTVFHSCTLQPETEEAQWPSRFAPSNFKIKVKPSNLWSKLPAWASQFLYSDIKAAWAFAWMWIPHPALTKEMWQAVVWTPDSEAIVIHSLRNYFYLQEEQKAWVSLWDLPVK